MKINGLEIDTNMSADDMYGYVNGYEYEAHNTVAKQPTVDNSTSMQNAEKGIWVQRDGTHIPIKKMQDSHIKNCIRMLERGEPNALKEVYIKQFEKELKKRSRDMEK